MSLFCILLSVTKFPKPTPHACSSLTPGAALLQACRGVISFTSGFTKGALITNAVMSGETSEGSVGPDIPGSHPGRAGWGEGSGSPELTPGACVHPHPAPGGSGRQGGGRPGHPPTSFSSRITLRPDGARAEADGSSLRHISKTYSIGRSFDGRDLLVIEFSRAGLASTS